MFLFRLSFASVLVGCPAAYAAAQIGTPILEPKSEIVHRCASHLSADGLSLMANDLPGYPAENSRSFEDYRAGVAGLESRAKALVAGDLVVDNGAGLGGAGFWFLKNTPANHAAINAQNFWDDLRQRSHWAHLEPITEKGEVPGQSYLFSVAGVRIDTLGRIAKAMGLYDPFDDGLGRLFFDGRRPPRSRFYQDALRSFVKSIVSTYERGVGEGRYEYHVGLTQNVLQHFRGKTNLLLDNWGGYFYAVDRMKQLREIYAALKVGGSALVHVSADGWGPTDTLMINGREVPMLEYFADRFPRSFQLMDFRIRKRSRCASHTVSVRSFILTRLAEESVDFDFERDHTRPVIWVANRVNPSIRFPDGSCYVKPRF